MSLLEDWILLSEMLGGDLRTRVTSIMTSGPNGKPLTLAAVSVGGTTIGREQAPQAASRWRFDHGTA